MADRPKIESANSRGADFGFKLWDRGLGTVTALSIILGGAWGLVRYLNERDEDLKIRAKEYRLALYKERKEMYYSMCKAVGEIAASKTRQEAEPAIKTFLTLFHGGVHIVSDTRVDTAKKDYYRAIEEFNAAAGNPPPPPELIDKGGALVRACKDSLDLEGVFEIPKPEPTSSPMPTN